VWWLRNRLRVQPRAQSGGAGDGAPPPAWDPHAVLGIRRGATAAEISRAYRAQMKLYHPDRVADLGPELRQVAHRKAIDIQRAYAELKTD
jgi:DnaJ-class molecular chaperone